MSVFEMNNYCIQRNLTLLDEPLNNDENIFRLLIVSGHLKFQITDLRNLNNFLSLQNFEEANKNIFSVPMGKLGKINFLKKLFVTWTYL